MLLEVPQQRVQRRARVLFNEFKDSTASARPGPERRATTEEPASARGSDSNGGLGCVGPGPRGEPLGSCRECTEEEPRAGAGRGQTVPWRGPGLEPKRPLFRGPWGVSLDAVRVQGGWGCVKHRVSLGQPDSAAVSGPRPLGGPHGPESHMQGPTAGEVCGAGRCCARLLPQGWRGWGSVRVGQTHRVGQSRVGPRVAGRACLAGRCTPVGKA